jgi:HNH endonuclease
MSQCAIDGCTGPSYRKGLCNKHRQRLRKYGDPLILKQHEKGAGGLNGDGYWQFEINGRSVRRHVLIAEKALGRRLPVGVEVHHVDGVKDNDAPGNLVICEDHGYHMLLHKRARAFKACGDAMWMSCSICKVFCEPSSMKKWSVRFVHAECSRRFEAARYIKRKEKGLL